MKAVIAFSFLFLSFSCYSQTGWKICNSPAFGNRVDDLFMLNTQVGYAVSGDGRIVKTTDGGENWVQLLQNSSVYCRSVEFVNEQKGFVGAFSFNAGSANILRKTTDGGLTWIDLTPQLPVRARGGICGLCIPDSNTIYGGGNWFEDAAYIIKSTDGGNTWGLIDMSPYATSIIDFNFTSRDTGFVTGKGPGPIESAIILYTTDGGQTWAVKYQNNVPSEYCWKIQRLTPRIYFASIEDLTSVAPRILKSVDGGMTWNSYQVSPVPYNIEGIGFIDPLHGWTGGGNTSSFESWDGGKTWSAINICPLMNRVFKVNDTMLFASGMRIWKYKGDGIYPLIPDQRFAWMTVNPNPVRGPLTINVSVAVKTRVLVLLLDESGRRMQVVDNADRSKGSYHFYINTDRYAPGIYYVVLKTHEDKRIERVIISR
jgi:photosystem II stability/assembly factor-like uncharacterized protein